MISISLPPTNTISLQLNQVKTTKSIIVIIQDTRRRRDRNRVRDARRSLQKKKSRFNNAFNYSLL